MTFAVYYSLYDIHIIELGVLFTDEVQNKIQFLSFAGIVNSISDGIKAAEFWQNDAICQAEMEAYLDGNLEIF